MPPQTRAVFIQYQTRIRVGATANSIIQSWSAKSAAQKAQWLAAYQDCVAADNDVAIATAATNAADVAFGAALAVVDNDPDSWATMATRRLAAAAAYRDLSVALTRKRDTWGALRGLEAAQPRSNPLSVTNAANERDAATRARVACRNSFAAYKRMFTHPPVPVDANGIGRMPAKWVTNLRETERTDARRGTVGLLRPGPGTWHQRTVRQGGQGDASIWVRVDANNNITDRVFRKEVVIGEGGWRDPKVWAGDVRLPTGRYPYELDCPNSLLNIAGFNAVPAMREGLHAGLLLPAAFAYRVYTEYSPHGDLGGLIRHYHLRHEPIPEPMIWNIAESLALCGFAMEHGHTNHGPGKIAMAPNWKSIIHRDLKPLNVLLNAPDPAIYPQYPHAVVTDFGLAFKTVDQDPTNPQWWNNSEGTPGFRPPEQQRLVDVDTVAPIEDDWTLGPWTNVYGVGLILYCLITLRQNPPGTLYLGDGEADERLKPPAAVWPSSTYSAELRDLVWQCLQYDDSNRIEFQDMLRDVRFRATITGSPEEHMRRGTADPLVIANFGLQLAAVQYQLGMALPP